LVNSQPYERTTEQQGRPNNNWIGSERFAFFVLAIALLSLVSTPLLPCLAVVFNNANWALATLVIGIVHFFAQIPGGHFYVGPLHWPKKLLAQITVLDLGAGAAMELIISSRPLTAISPATNAINFSKNILRHTER